MDNNITVELKQFPNNNLIPIIIKKIYNGDIKSIPSKKINEQNINVLKQVDKIIEFNNIKYRKNGTFVDKFIIEDDETKDQITILRVKYTLNMYLFEKEGSDISSQLNKLLLNLNNSTEFDNYEFFRIDYIENKYVNLIIWVNELNNK